MSTVDMSSESRQSAAETGEKFCTDCGKKIKAKAEICPHCGVRQSPASGGLGPVADNGKSRLVAAIFAFFLGAIGVHKFYLRQYLQGTIYLLLCWTLIPALIALVETVLYLAMPDETFNKKHGQR